MHALEVLDDLGQPGLERRQPAQVRVADQLALRRQLLLRLAERAVGAAPADHEHVAGLGAAEVELADVLRDPRDLLGADVGLLLVVVRRVRDVAGQRVLLDAADPVLEAGRAGDHPGARERPRVALVDEVAVRVGAVHDVEPGQRREVGQRPRLAAVGDVAVAQQHHRHHVAGRDLHRLDRAVERVARRLGREHRHRRLAVAAVQRLQQIGLLGLGRQAGRRTAALDVEDHHRQLGHDAKADRLALERDARARRRGHRDRAAVGRAERRAHRRDLVLGLERHRAEVLVLGERVQDRRCRRDRIARVEQLLAGELGADDEAERDRLVAGDVAVHARLEHVGRHLVRRSGTPRRSRRSGSRP